MRMKELSVSMLSNTQAHTETPRAIDSIAGAFDMRGNSVSWVGALAEVRTKTKTSHARNRNPNTYLEVLGGRMPCG
jgi:hypothetical protein